MGLLADGKLPAERLLQPARVQAVSAVGRATESLVLRAAACWLALHAAALAARWPVVSVAAASAAQLRGAAAASAAVQPRRAVAAAVEPRGVVLAAARAPVAVADAADAESTVT
jgi:hypothetical protein